MSKFKISPNSLISLVIDGKKDVGLEIGTICSLLDVLPTGEEVNLVANYQGEESSLEAPERYIMELRRIPVATK